VRARLIACGALILAFVLAAPAAAARQERKPTYRVIEQDVFIPMDDGVKLAATIGLPSKDGRTVAPGRFPPILTMTPYGKDLSSPIDYFVSRGYVHAVADIRGAGASEGNLDDNYFSPREQRDGAALIEWLARQPWSNGRVGMVGGSYEGITQYLAAEQQPPHLKAIVPSMSLGDLYREATYHGGILSQFFGAQYLAVQGGPGLFSGFNEPSEYDQVIPAKVDQAQSDPIAFDYLARNTYDAWYRERSPIERVEKIRAAVLVYDGWFDGFIRGASEMYPAIRSPKRLWIDPYPHKGPRGFPFNPAGYEEQHSLLRGALVWLDRYLKGIKRPNAKPVKVFVMGRDRYLLARRWPVEGTEWTRLYLKPGGGLGFGAPRKATASYPTNPHAGWTNTFSRHGNLAATPYYPADQTLERGEGLVFETPALRTPLTLAGPLALHMDASSSASRTDWFVKLSDVAPDGEATLITEGYLRATFRALDHAKSLPWRPYHPHDREVALEPGRFYPFEIEVWPTANEFRRGHRLRIQIVSADSPNHAAGSARVDRDDPSTFQFEPNPAAINTVRLGPSYLLAPRIERCAASGRRLPARPGQRLGSVISRLGVAIREKRAIQTFCLRTGGGHIKVGYRDNRALRSERSRAIAVLTTSGRFRVRGVRVGSRARRLGRRLFVVNGVSVYERRRTRRVRFLVGVRKRRIAYTALMDSRRVRSRNAARVQLLRVAEQPR
jgi:putative CocE/NonD family hydrolase